MTPLCLAIDSAALLANYRWLAARAAVPMAAAIKADGYGLGARQVLACLAAEGCRQFAVSSFDEAEALGRLDAGLEVLVLHGLQQGDEPAARRLPHVRPVLNTPAQVARWAAAFPGRPADLMVETGMNRLGLAPLDLAAALAAVPVQVVHSHLAAADEPGHPLTALQLARFRAIVAASPGVMHALANSAGICHGSDFAFDLVRPGLGLYGGQPHPDAEVRPVVRPRARIIQLHDLQPGDAVGYGATFVAARPCRVATLNLGYADGLFRALAPALAFRAGDRDCPVIGRISMDMVAADVTDADVAEGDWLELPFDIPALAAESGLSQYELLVTLSRRYLRRWS
jgi:alanine racemase